MSNITVEVILPVGVEEAWEELRHIDRHVNWMLDAKSITFDNDQREGVGTSFLCVTQVGPFVTKDKMTVTAWQPPLVMGVRHSGLITGSGAFRLEESNGRTHMTWSEKLNFPWWLFGSLGSFVAKPILSFVWKKNLGKLQRILASKRD